MGERNEPNSHRNDKKKCPLLLIMLARPYTKYKYDIDNC